LRYQAISSGGIGAEPLPASCTWFRPRPVSTFLRDDLAEDREAEQEVELLGRHLGQHALLELEPQPRHRDEQRRAGALQVGRKVSSVSAKNTWPRPSNEGGAFDVRRARRRAPAAGTTAPGRRSWPDCFAHLLGHAPRWQRVTRSKLCITPLGVPVEPEV
jgi:hypothetical protein